MSSFKFKNVYLLDKYSIAGIRETTGEVKSYDKLINDYYYGCKTFEHAEIKMQQEVIDNLISQNNLHKKIDLLVSGELSNQVAISSYSAMKYNIPYLGCYSACASFNESLIILSSLIDAKKIKYGIALTSSHNLVAERQFRFPVEYGAPRPKRSTFTATGAAGCILTTHPTNIKIESATIGEAKDYGIKDVYNMGAVMAPATAITLLEHLNDLDRPANYYDLILTGDLGEVGTKLFHEFLKSNGIKLNNHIDAGSILYESNDTTNSGSSGPVTLPLVLFNKILKSKKYHRILLLATGSLHCPTLVNQHDTIPGICHAISMEVNL